MYLPSRHRWYFKGGPPHPTKLLAINLRSSCLQARAVVTEPPPGPSLMLCNKKLQLSMTDVPMMTKSGLTMACSSLNKNLMIMTVSWVTSGQCRMEFLSDSLSCRGLFTCSKQSWRPLGETCALSVLLENERELVGVRRSMLLVCLHLYNSSVHILGQTKTVTQTPKSQQSFC